MFFQKVNKTLLGCVFYSVAMFISVAISVFVKKTMVQYNVPSWEVIAIRQSVIFVVLIPFMIKMKFNFFDKHAIKLNLARNVLYAFTTWLMYVSLVKIPVNNCVSIQFLVPVIASVLAIFFLKEKGSFMVWLALIVCLFGAFIVKNPVLSTKGELYAYGMLFLAVILRSITIVMNGRLAANFSTATLTFYTHSIMLFTSLVFFKQFVAVPFEVFVILGCAGLFYCLEYILIYKAHKFCTVLTIQPLEFSKMVYSIVLSSLVLGEMTTKNQIIGSIVILSGFVFMVIGKNKIEVKKIKQHTLRENKH